MRLTKSFLLFTIVTLSAFSTVLYTSCSKSNDPCSGVICYNSGVCVSGSCSCPTGYSGVSCELSSITFQNNTFTPVSITVNGNATSIPVGNSVSYVGTSGTAAAVSASTTGSVGEIPSWNFTDNFPTGGNQLVEPLNVGTSYFFLEITNNDVAYINKIYVNYLYTNQYIENVNIPDDGINYGIGYFTVNSTSNSQLSVDFSGGGIYTSTVFTIPYANNTYAHVIVP